MTKRTGKPAGRPTTYTQEVADKICERLANGESLRKICLDADMPDKTTVLRWLAAFEAFRTQYARARELQADTLFDDILTIADTPQLGEKRKDDGEKVEVTTGDMIEHRRLQVDARKWMAAKLNPKKYGEKIEHSGSIDVTSKEQRDAAVAAATRANG